MRKSIDVYIDPNSWNKQNQIPAAFNPGGQNRSYRAENFSFNMNTCLNLIGLLTTPANINSSTINSMWAQFRYYNAFIEDRQNAQGGTDDRLCLKNAFSELDPHQKMILSDDFGMGIPITYLSPKFNYTHFADGLYFIKNMKNLVDDVSFATEAKKGSRKSPDFVFADKYGKFHVVECKGTQSGYTYLREQIRRGIQQKRSLVIDANYAGESLVAGVSIVTETPDYFHPDQESLMLIADPDEKDEKTLELDEKNKEDAKRILRRGALARSFAYCGYYETADALAFDNVAYSKGREDFMTSESREAGFEYEFERERKRYRISRENMRAEQTSRPRLDIDGKIVRGREEKIRLPTPIIQNDKRYQHILVRTGLEQITIDEIFELSNDTPEDQGVNIDQLEGVNFDEPISFEDDETQSIIKFGDNLRSEVKLLEE